MVLRGKEPMIDPAMKPVDILRLALEREKAAFQFYE